MEITNRKIISCYFSPTGNTRLAADNMAEELSRKLNSDYTSVDFTFSEKRNQDLIFDKDDIVILGMPVFAGRLPNKIMPFVRDRIKGNGNPVICLVTYGNRSYGEALNEMAFLCRQNGMKVIGGIAVVSEHSFADTLATGKPDSEELAVVAEFASRISDKLACEDYSMKSTIGEKLPEEYYVPLKEDGTPAKFLKAAPKVDMSLCTGCKKCAEACPMGSIDMNDPANITGICIKCQSCIKKCPAGARHFDDEAFLSHRRMLMKNYSELKKTEYFL